MRDKEHEMKEEKDLDCMEDCMILDSLEDFEIPPNISAFLPIFFEFDEFQLSDNNKGKLVELAQYLKLKPNLKIEIQEIKFDELNTVIKDNLMPTFNMIKYILPIMKKQNSGIIINVSSRSGRRGVPRLSAYCSAKFAVRGLTESVAKEVENNNIKCISISPGGVNTDMRRRLFGDKDAVEQQPTSRIIDIVVKILSEKIQVPNGADVLIVKDKKPVIKVPES